MIVSDIAIFVLKRDVKLQLTVTMTVNLPVTPEKCHHTTSRNAELIHLMEGILFSSTVQTLVALKRAGCRMWQLECQTSNVTATICSTWA